MHRCGSRYLNPETHVDRYRCFLGTRPVPHLEHRTPRGLGAAKHDARLHEYRVRGRKSKGVERLARQGRLQGSNKEITLMTKKLKHPKYK